MCVDRNVNKWITKTIAKSLEYIENIFNFIYYLHRKNHKIINLSTNNKYVVDNKDVSKICVYLCG